MSQQALIPINPGDAADADVISGNFTYLNDRITATNSAMTTLDNNVTNTVNTTVQQINTTVENTLSVYQDVNTLATSGTISLDDNSVNKISPTLTVTFQLPTISGEDVDKYHQILVQIKFAGTTNHPTINLGTTYYFNAAKPDFIGGTLYDLIYEYNPLIPAWQCGAVFIGTES